MSAQTYRFLAGGLGSGDEEHDGCGAEQDDDLVDQRGGQGAVMLGAVGVWGLALAGFGVVDGLVPTLLCLAVAGAADSVSVTSGGTLVQLDTPDGLRGRINSVQYAIGAGGPGLGDARAGFVAGLATASVSAVSGGLACVAAVAVIAMTHPAMRRWRQDANPVDGS